MNGSTTNRKSFLRGIGALFIGCMIPSILKKDPNSSRQAETQRLARLIKKDSRAIAREGDSTIC